VCCIPVKVLWVWNADSEWLAILRAGLRLCQLLNQFFKLLLLQTIFDQCQPQTFQQFVLRLAAAMAQESLRASIK
jgi:hypothetical protein